jgi:hypothetical protein
MKGTAKLISLEIEQDQLIFEVEYQLGEDDIFIREMEIIAQPNIETVIKDTLKSELKRMLRVIKDTLKSELKRMLRVRVNENTIRENLVDLVISETVIEEKLPV